MINLKKIGIINCFDVSQRCSSSGCFKAAYNKTGSFTRYEDEDIQVISFVHCNGCSDNSTEQVLARAERMKKVGVDVIHLSTCIKSKCPYYDDFIAKLSEKYDVVGYSHGKKKK